jgi:signal transduction histidine kinase
LEKKHAMDKTLKIRPYARLLTMLGEQLIKNEQIALAELIKNSYDADADWVKVSFDGFDKNMEITDQSKIIIEDNGNGMSIDTIEKSWMNPATPNKLSKDGIERKTENKKRIIQGEKGIGRFAILKLGRKIKITTREYESNEEIVIDYDLSAYDDNFLTEDRNEKELFIDDINIRVFSQIPKEIIDREVKVNHATFKNNNNKGTIIEISSLKGSWSENKIQSSYQKISKLQSIFDKIFNKKPEDVFEIGFEVRGIRETFRDEDIERLELLFENSSVLRIENGRYSEKDNCFYFNINGDPFKISLDDALIRGIKQIFRKQFHLGEDLFNNDIWRKPECGPFKFTFFVFDFNAKDYSKYYLQRKEKELLKEHRIYLYRDGIRVAPYGDPDDDWLQIDMFRGTISAGMFLSNDQVVGCVDITKKNNPKLKDKTNREGLIEEGNATSDFITLIQTVLFYIRQHPYQQYQERIKDRTALRIHKSNQIDNEIGELKDKVSNNPVLLSAVKNIAKAYKLERNYFEKRIETTEDLAGIGLSVETATHDIMLMFSKGILFLDDLIKDCFAKSIEPDQVIEELQKIRGVFSFIENQMKDIQLLFKSTKQRRKNIRVNEILNKVVRIYSSTLKRERITLNIDELGSPIIAKCTDAVLLQLFINLFDNAIYWLSVLDKRDREIRITIDGNKNQLIFSDNGQGILEDDAPFIFEPFYSAKEDGRGLGLYIARQLLERIDYSIWLAEIKSEKILKGANFVVSFVKSENDD